MIDTQEDVSTLSYLGYVLEESGFSTRWVAADENPQHPYEQLLVVARQDAQGQELVVRLVLAEEIMQGLAKTSGQKLPPKTYSSSLQFTLWFASLPAIPETQLGLLDRVLNAVNQKLPFGLLSHNNTDGLHLRHSFFLNAEESDPRLVAEIISALGFLGAKYTALFSPWLTGKKPGQALLKELS